MDSILDLLEKILQERMKDLAQALSDSFLDELIDFILYEVNKNPEISHEDIRLQVLSKMKEIQELKK